PIGLPSAHEDWQAIEAACRPRAVIELSRFGDERQGARRAAFTQASSYGGRLKVLAEDLRDQTRRGEAVLIISQQSSRLAASLADEGIPVHSLGNSVEAIEP